MNVVCGDIRRVDQANLHVYADADFDAVAESCRATVLSLVALLNDQAALGEVVNHRLKNLLIMHVLQQKVPKTKDGHLVYNPVSDQLTQTYAWLGT